MIDLIRPIRSLLLVVALFLAILVVACVTVPGPATEELDEEGALHLSGLCFGPYLDGQSPSLTGPLPPEQIRELLAVIANSTDSVRSYGNDNGLDAIGRYSHEIGKKAAIGAWLSRNRTLNEQQIDTLIQMGQYGEADVLIVGSETLLRADLTKAELLGYIERVKKAVPGVPVTTAETYGIYLHNPELFTAVDQVYVHIHPYWDGVWVDTAVDTVDEAYSSLLQRAGSRPVVIAETGWPSAGEPNGAAVPSMENAEQYLRAFTAWADREQVSYFYFEAFDEAWKKDSEGEVGANWGLWNHDGQPKYGLLGGRTTGVTPMSGSSFTRTTGGIPKMTISGRTFVAIGPLPTSLETSRKW